MRSSFAVTVLGLLLSACVFRHGETVDSYPPAQGPEGLPAVLAVEGRGTLQGELLEVAETGLLVRAGRVIYRVRYTRIRRASFPTDSEELSFRGPSPPRPEVRERLRLVSRFPQGMDEGLLARLLEAYGQDEVVDLGGAPLESADSLAALVRTIREATVRFQDRTAAIREGYRKLGPDFPAMGEHWIQPGLVVAGELDPTRPPVLSYATLEGQVTLTGVAFTVPLGEKEEPPPFLGRKEVWHDHSKRVDEESLLLNHAGATAPSNRVGGRGPRLAMVHVWAWTENPEGVLVQHNWALPFRRVGLPVPEDASSAARRALSLAGGGVAYYETLLSAALGGSPEEEDERRRVLRAHGARVETWLGQQDRGGEVPRARQLDLEPLVTTWESLWEALEEGRSAAARESLRELRDGLGG